MGGAHAVSGTPGTFPFLYTITGPIPKFCVHKGQWPSSPLGEEKCQTKQPENALRVLQMVPTPGLLLPGQGSLHYTQVLRSLQKPVEGVSSVYTAYTRAQSLQLENCDLLVITY